MGLAHPDLVRADRLAGDRLQPAHPRGLRGVAVQGLVVATLDELGAPKGSTKLKSRSNVSAKTASSSWLDSLTSLCRCSKTRSASLGKSTLRQWVKSSALSLAVRKSVVGLTRMLQIAAAVLGGALIFFGLSHTLWLSLVLMIFAEFGLIQGASVSNTIIQSLVTEGKRARVMSYYTMAFFGASPFGSLLAGLLAHRIGAPLTVIITGAFCVAGSLWFTLERPKIRMDMRPIYQELRLLPAREAPVISDVEEPVV